MAAWASVASSALQIGGNWISAAQTWKTSKMNYKQMRQDADTIRKESREEAARIRFEADKFAKQQMMDFISSGATGRSIVDAFAETSRRSICAVMHSGRPSTVGMDSNTPTPRWMIRSETGSFVSFSGRNTPSI